VRLAEYVGVFLIVAGVVGYFVSAVTGFWVRHIKEAERKRMERRRGLAYPWIRIWECEVRSGEYKQIILSLVGRGAA
jgi:hypothetical protein